MAELEGETVGLVHICLLRSFLHRAPSGTIEELVVSGRYRGRGVGRRLISTAITWCLKQGCSEVEVSTAWGNAVGLALYRGLGFAERGIWLERGSR
jgi:GNAT superfamily N-acetyltransferase